MNRVSRCDWLPERARWSILPARDKGFVPEEKLKLFWSFIPYNNLFYWLGLLGQDRYWPGFFCVFINTQEKNKKTKNNWPISSPSSLVKPSPSSLSFYRRRDCISEQTSGRAKKRARREQKLVHVRKG